MDDYRFEPREVLQPPVPYEDFKYSFPSLSRQPSPFHPLGLADLDPSAYERHANGLPPHNVLPHDYLQLDPQAVARLTSGYDTPLHSTALPPSLPPGSPKPLFDPSETALFSQFLNTMDVNQDFLFDPVLPDGIPSLPTPADFAQATMTERQYRDVQLGEGLQKMHISPGRQPPLQLEPQQRTDSRIRKEADDAGANESGRNSGGRSKKVKVEEVETMGAGSTSRSGFAEQDVDMRPVAGPSRLSNPKSESKAPLSSLSLYPDTSFTARREFAPLAKKASSASPTSQADLKKGLLSDSQKRSNHILSEQKRRNAIRNGFRDLVEILNAGETLSGISIGGIDGDGSAQPETGKKGKGKGKGSGRGRGRKGEVGAGASKSVVLERAVEYVRWLERGNTALREEVERVEAIVDPPDRSKALGSQPTQVGVPA